IVGLTFTSGFRSLSPARDPTASAKSGGQEMNKKTLDREVFALPELDFSEPPAGSDRRAFMMQSAMVAAIVSVGGQASPLFGKVPATAPPLGSQPIDPNLQVVKD